MRLAAKKIFWGDRPLDLPNDARPVGYAWLVETFNLRVMPNHRWSFVARVGGRQRFVEQHITWETLPERYAPSDIFEQFVFALKYDGLNLEILEAALATLDDDTFIQLERGIRSRPTGAYGRRLWYLIETLGGRRLDLPDVTQGSFVELFDSTEVVTAPGVRKRRQRVIDNRLGVPGFSPLVRRTPALDRFQSADLPARAARLLGAYDADLLVRAATCLYSKETRSSFEIERETPSPDRMRRFVDVLRRVPTWATIGKRELLELQNLIVDQRFADRDYRVTQNYVGEALGHGVTRVHFVSPRPVDLPPLMDAWVACAHSLIGADDVDAVVLAAVLAFGFVFLHPFEDGNGRLHRALIHWALARRGFTPSGVILPVSATILARRTEYDACLERFSGPLMERTDYVLDDSGGVSVKSDTALHFRSFDATPMVEALYAWLEHTIEHDFRRELDFMAAFREARRAIVEIVDLPDRLADLFVVLTLRADGKLSKTKRDRHFAMLSADEVEALGDAVRRAAARFGVVQEP